VEVCYRPPDQEKQVDEALYRHIEAASLSKALILMGDVSHPCTCWQDNTAGGSWTALMITSFSK